MIGHKIACRISVTLLLSLCAVFSHAQCNCPPLANCKPCTGGYTSLTLKYNGPATALVLIIDNENTLANLTLAPQEEFTIRGSKKNEKFADKLVPVLVNGIVNTLLGPSCTDLRVGTSYGSFTIISAVTLGGNIVCCTTASPDAVAPFITNIPGTISIFTNSCSTQVSWVEPTASDNCQIANFYSSHKPGDYFSLGTTPVMYTAVDQAGLQSTVSFNVVVHDQEAPVLSGGPEEDLVVNVTESCSATVSWIEPQTTNDCSVTITKSHQQNDRFNLGTTQVEYTARDASGNFSTFKFNVVVVDRDKPEFTNFPKNIVAVLESECSLHVSWNEPTAFDQCSATVLSGSHKPGDEFFAGVTPVRYTARDQHGNEITQEFTVTVNDERPLTILDCPSKIVLKTEQELLTPARWIEPSLSVSCEKVTFDSNYQPQSLMPVGTTKVEYVAQTASGKTASCSFDVVVVLEEKQIQVAKLVTPDGDGLNDEWKVGNIENFRDNKVLIVDRWGGVIFEATRYDNRTVVWKGTNKSGGPVPTGTYFYSVVASDGEKRIQEAGSIEVVR